MHSRDNSLHNSLHFLLHVFTTNFALDLDIVQLSLVSTMMTEYYLPNSLEEPLIYVNCVLYNTRKV